MRYTYCVTECTVYKLIVAPKLASATETGKRKSWIVLA
jgi:hypothetical protein